jgi:multiple sugar transport system permease protein
MARSWWKTTLAIALTALMLFPVYWMVNVSFTRREAIRLGKLLPLDFTTDNYRIVLHEQLPFLATSLIVGLGTVLLTVAIAAPAGYGLARLKVPGGSSLRWCRPWSWRWASTRSTRASGSWTPSRA